jgi:hypothetical protein
MSRFALISFSLLTLAMSTQSQEPRAGNISFEPYSFKTYDQQEHPAELGKLWVAENRSKNNGGLIQLALVRLTNSKGMLNELFPDVSARFDLNSCALHCVRIANSIER